MNGSSGFRRWGLVALLALAGVPGASVESSPVVLSREIRVHGTGSKGHQVTYTWEQNRPMGKNTVCIYIPAGPLWPPTSIRFFTERGLAAYQTGVALQDGDNCNLIRVLTYKRVGEWNRHIAILQEEWIPPFLAGETPPREIFALPGGGFLPGALEVVDGEDGVLTVRMSTDIFSTPVSAYLTGIKRDIVLALPCPIVATTPPALRVEGAKATWRLGTNEPMAPFLEAMTAPGCLDD
ncbi:hypothetical protein IIA16_00620 [bacterium]|nr:hypothetical protein [bacterium]